MAARRKQTDDFWDRIKSEREKKLESLRKRFESVDPLDAIKRGTVEALGAVVDGEKGRPVVDDETDRFLIPSEEWADRIRSLAAAWRQFPGERYLTRLKVCDEGTGTRAGERLFELALKRASVKTIAQEIDKAKDILGAYPDPNDRVRGSLPKDFDYGLWLYFRRLQQAFDPDSVSVDPRPSTRAPALPDPDPDVLAASVRKLSGTGGQETLTPRDMLALYGLGDVPIEQFRRSTKYVARGTSAAEHQLPSRKKQRGSGGRLSARDWSRAEVAQAVRGWARKLGIEDPGPF